MFVSERGKLNHRNSSTEQIVGTVGIFCCLAQIDCYLFEVTRFLVGRTGTGPSSRVRNGDELVDCEIEHDEVEEARHRFSNMRKDAGWLCV